MRAPLPTPAPAPARPALEAANLGVRLGRRAIVEGVSFSLCAGQRVAVVGPNGSGKTTLLRACAGVLPPATGEVRLSGRPLVDYKRRELARRLGFMPQHADLRFPMSGVEAVLLGRSPHKRGLGLADAADLELAGRALDRLDIGHLAERSVTAMSGGERQRLMVARLLVQEAAVLLMDEPTSAQDPAGVRLVRALIAEQAKAGQAILASVHDLNLALAGFDAILVLAKGRALTLGPPTQVLDSGALETAFGLALYTVDDGDRRWIVPH